MNSIKLDLHIHTIYSGDSLVTPDSALHYAVSKGLDGIAITDHNTLKGYNILKKKNRNNKLIIIPGMEIKTKIGEILALFIDQEIKPKSYDFISVVEEVKENNGLVVIPHPFDFLRNNRLRLNLLNGKMIKKYIDGIEILNSRIIFKRCVEEARRFNQKYYLFETGGSDAHTKKEIGNGYTLIKNISDNTINSIQKSLLSHNSKSEGILSPSFVHLSSIINKLRKGLYF